MDGAWISDLSRSGTFAYLVTGTPLVMLCFKWVFVRFLHLKDPTLNKIAGSQRQQKQILGPIEDQNPVITNYSFNSYFIIFNWIGYDWVLGKKNILLLLEYFVEQICTFSLQFILRKKKLFYAKIGYKICIMTRQGNNLPIQMFILASLYFSTCVMLCNVL